MKSPFHLLFVSIGLLLAQPAGAAEATEEWGYEGMMGPAYWSRLEWENALCELGVHQSPIDLTAASEIQFTELERFAGSVKLDVDKRAEVLDLLDNGHTIQVTNNAEIGLTIDGKNYTLLQFHFHAPSEHTIDGRQFPLEAHFVMGSEDGRLAVVGYLYEEGDADPDFDPIVASLPQGVGGQRHIDGQTFEVGKLKPLASAFYAYPGSLTTPPCSEGVRWLVSAEPQQMSAVQLEAFTSLLHNNNRPVQPRHMRPLLLVKPEE